MSQFSPLSENYTSEQTLKHFSAVSEKNQQCHTIFRWKIRLKIVISIYKKKKINSLATKLSSDCLKKLKCFHLYPNISFVESIITEIPETIFVERQLPNILGLS